MENRQVVQRIALSRMGILLDLAEKRTVKQDRTDLDKKLAKRYVRLAREMSSHYKVGMPAALKRRICRKCNNLLVPGLNCKVVVASVHGYVAYVCECGNETRLHYKDKKAGTARPGRRLHGVKAAGKA
jgi:ribonuclease P protein subunit RPR2